MKFYAAFVLLVVFQAARAWEYSNQANWKDSDELCGGCFQSPVNIDTTYATTDDSMDPMTFYKYGVAPGSQMTVTLNTHTVQVSWDDQGANNPTIRDGGLPGEYKAGQFHFHWGTDNTQGSEHTLDDKKFPAEVHIVHYLNNYGSIGEALGDTQGLAVVGMFIEEDGEDNADFAEMFEKIEAFDPINLAGDSQTATINAFTLEKLLPSSTKNFYRYKGSLTTPTCNEVVVWTVMKETIKMSANQLGKLRAILRTTAAGKEGLGNTFRETLPMNFRPLTYRQAGWLNFGLKDFFRGFSNIGGVRN